MKAKKWRKNGSCTYS